MNTADTINNVQFDIRAILKRLQELVEEYNDVEEFNSAMDAADFLTGTIDTLEILLNEFKAYRKVTA